MVKFIKAKENRKIVVLLICILVFLLLGIAFLLFPHTEVGKKFTQPNLYLQTDAELVAMSGETFYVDVKLSDFPEQGVYPAVSFLLDFDTTQLEFLGLRLGNMSACDENGENISIPEWQANVDVSNKNGSVSAMYLDMTAEDNSYRAAGYEKDAKDILVRVEFNLKDSVSCGDEILLSFSDAVLASVTNEIDGSSLSMVNETLFVKDFTATVQ